jgi:hypothetical protein
MFVDDPRYGGLFGNVVGREGHGFRQGDQDNGVVVPAIPAAELSGKVLDDGDHPITGCQIELFKPRSLRGPLELIAVNRPAARSALDGEYRFTDLDAGIYYLFAKCNGSSRIPYYLSARQEDTTPKEQRVWTNLLYPDAHKLSEAKAVIAMPGQRIKGLDFRLTRTRGFRLKGHFVWADGDGPKLLDVYSNDLLLIPLDLGIAENQRESFCQWNTYPGEFECFKVTPGRYRLGMMISPIWIDADRGHPQRQNDQLGEMEVDLRDEAPGPVALKMRRVNRSWPDTTPKTPAKVGWLDIVLTGCGSHEFRLMSAKIWDERGKIAPVLRYAWQGKHPGQTELAPGRYRVSATCRAYWGSHNSLYFDEVLAEKGFPTEVRAERTTKIRIHALSAEEIYRVAVAHLRAQSGLKN